MNSMLNRPNNVAFVTRHFSDNARNSGVTSIRSQVICSEKPDFTSVENILHDVITEAPARLAAQLKPMTALRKEWSKGRFDLQLSPILQTAQSIASAIRWTPPADLSDALKGNRLLSNDKIQSDDNWLDTFAKQVAAIRLCHVRHISKKGADLETNRHFDAHLQHETHPSYQGRVRAAMEVLSSGNIPAQGKELLINAIEQAGYRGEGPLELHCMRPVKDYDDHSNSYNFLTAVYAKLLRDAIINAARVYYPTTNIHVYDEPVMMLTKTNRTDADSLGRIVKQPLFKLADVAGKNVIITDDHVNAGAFTATLISQAEASGANVVGVSAFSRHPNSSNLILEPEVKEALLKLHTLEEIDELLGRVGVCVDTLTNREGLTLLSILMDGENQNHLNIFNSTLSAVNGQYHYLLDGIGDDLTVELQSPPQTPQHLLAEIDSMFASNNLR